MIKKCNGKKKEVDPIIRAKLIRKGNEFFQSGDINSAEKIFITVDYKDGLVRLGDHYLKVKNIYKSAEMYFMSENKSKINTFCKKCALIIEKFLTEDKKYDKIIIEKK